MSRRKASYFDDWSAVPDQEEYDNAFRAEWALFLRHVVLDAPFRWNLLDGAKGVQLAQKATESWEAEMLDGGAGAGGLRF